MPDPDPTTWVRIDRSRGDARRTSALRHPLLVLRGLVLRRRGLSERHPVPTTREEVLARLCELPLSTWTYGWDHPTVKHLGPMAQDFARAFGLGSSDRRIDGVDAVGVVMAAVQALARRVDELESRLTRTDAVR